MTESKRFTINTLDGSVDLRDNGKVMTYKQTVELLNNLSEENEQLKTLNNAYLQDIEELNIEKEDLQNELLQCTAVIEKKWSEYLKEKELSE